VTGLRDQRVLNLSARLSELPSEPFTIEVDDLGGGEPAARWVVRVSLK
jgi:hypothetical protein